MRIDRRRLETSTFPTVIDIQSRFSDLDVQGHINNVAAAELLQEGRVQFNRAMRMSSIGAGLRSVVAALCIEYVEEMRDGIPVTISTGVLSIGRTSVTVGQVAGQMGRTTLYAETVLVLTDSNGPVVIPDSLRAAYEGALITPIA